MKITTHHITRIEGKAQVEYLIENAAPPFRIYHTVEIDDEGQTDQLLRDQTIAAAIQAGNAEKALHQTETVIGTFIDLSNGPEVTWQAPVAPDPEPTMESQEGGQNG